MTRPGPVLCMMLRCLLCALALTGAGVTPAAAQAPDQATVEVLPLKFRQASEIIPLVRPILNPGEAVSGMDSRLILRASPQRIQELTFLVAQFDTEPMGLTLTVRQGRGRMGTTQGFGFDRRRTRDGEPGLRLNQTQRSDNLDQEFTVNTLEGRPALIEVGNAVPVGQTFLTFTPFGINAVESVQYYDLASGFYAVPRVAGGRVTVEIHPRLENPGRLGAARFERTGAMTTVSGRLGEWLPIGGTSETRSIARDSTTASTRRTTDESTSIWLKVDGR